MKTIKDQAEFNNSREFIIANFCAVEIYINLLISNYFFGKPNYDFIANVMENPYTNFAFRLSVLEHTFPEKKEFNQYKNKLMRLSALRNLYAHNLPTELENEGKLIYLFKNSKGTKFEPINAEEIADEFYNLFKEIEGWLEEKIKEFGAAEGFKSEDAMKFELGRAYTDLFEIGD